MTPIKETFESAARLDNDNVPDEVTLVDAQVLPAINRQGTQGGGHSLPVLRVPFSAIDSWWIADGSTIKGRGGSQVGWGFLFPIGD